MRVSLDWLGELIDLPAESLLGERLEMGGFEDVLVLHTGPDLAGIKVGRVEVCEPHPNADKLRLCSVDAGEDELRPIVCGAPNVAAGQKIAVAVPGTRLPDGTKLKKAKIRGQVSLGMICSSRELGLGEDHEGILVLPDDAPVGAPLALVLASGTRILEIGITPNRGDTASLLGLAREVRAFFGGDLRAPETAVEECGAPADAEIRVEIEAGDGCHHYAARIVRGVRVGQSPEWVVQRLEASGLRSINNVVDATNLALLEFGQPLHAFDLRKLAGGVVRVRRAAPGEALVTLDGVERKLDPSDLVIADAERAIALAGVMGGAESEVDDDSVDLLIESAHFHPTTVRLTARRHGLHSEASYRFERGVDREGVVRAADRTARLLAELAGGAVAPGLVEARGDAPAATTRIDLDVTRTNRLLGTDIPRDEARGLLERVGVHCEPDGEDGLVCQIPSHRNDLHLHQDLSEEIARIYGYEHIPTTLPSAQLEPATAPAAWTLACQARDALAATGLVETMTMPFVSEAEMSALRLAADDVRATPLRLANPLQEQDRCLRTTLVPSLLRLAHLNQSRQRERVRLFEITRTFLPPRGETASPAEEPLWAVAVLAGQGEPRLWGAATPPPIFFEARGVMERLLSAVGYVASLRRGGSPYFHPGACADVVVGKRVVGAVGELHPEVAAAYEIDAPCAFVELNLSALLAEKKKESQFREVSREPSIRRDAAFLVAAVEPAGALLAAIAKAAGKDLVSVDVFDRYEGRGVPEGRVSLAFRLVFQRTDRTLTDEEVSKSMDRVTRTLTDRFGAELR